MKKLFTALAVGIVAFALSGCNGSAPVVKITPAQFFAAACEPVQQALALAPWFADTLSPTVEKQISDAQPMVTAACARGATVSVANVQQFSDTVLPAANAVIQAAPATLISSDSKTKIGGAIALAQLAVDTVSAIATNAAAQGVAAPAPASGVAPS